MPIIEKLFNKIGIYDFLVLGNLSHEYKAVYFSVIDKVIKTIKST